MFCKQVLKSLMGFLQTVYVTEQRPFRCRKKTPWIYAPHMPEGVPGRMIRPGEIPVKPAGRSGEGVVNSTTPIGDSG
jgi:hypothetical protein